MKTKLVTLVLYTQEFDNPLKNTIRYYGQVYAYMPRVSRNCRQAWTQNLALDIFHGLQYT